MQRYDKVQVGQNDGHENTIRLVFCRTKQNVKKRIQAYEPVLFFYDRTKCTATLFFFGRYQFVSLTMNIDNFNLIIVFEMLTQLCDVNIH